MKIAFSLCLFLSLGLFATKALAEVPIAVGQNLSIDTLIPDSSGTYHLIVDPGIRVPESISRNPKVIIHDAVKVRNSLAIGKADYEIVDSSVSRSDLDKNAPKRSPLLRNETFHEMHNTNCENGETVSAWWLRSNPAAPNATDSVAVYANIIFQANANPWWNYVVVNAWGTQCTAEAFLTYTPDSTTPKFDVRDWTCNPSSSGCAGQAGVGACDSSVSKATLQNGYVANKTDGVHTFPVIYMVNRETYTPSENATYPYKNEVILYRFSTSTWVQHHLRRHSIRTLIPTTGYQRASWIEYHYTHGSGPGCSGQTHPDFGVIDYWLCKTPYGGSGCQWYRPTSGDSFVSNDFANPVTIQHQIPSYTFHVTKP